MSRQIKKNSSKLYSEYEDLRSDAMVEFVRRRDSFILDWGIMIMLAIVLAIFLLAGLIRRPELIVSRKNVLIQNLPKEMRAEYSGTIEFVIKDGWNVRKGQVVGLVGSGAKYAYVMALSSDIRSANKRLLDDKFEETGISFNTNTSNLGELKFSCDGFFAKCKEVNEYLGNGLFVRKLVKLKMELKHIQHEDLQQEKLNEIAELECAISSQKRTFKEQLRIFSNQIEMWIRDRVIRAPIDGIVKYSNGIKVNHFIGKGMIIGYIMPPGKAEYYVEASIDRKTIREVNKNNMVRLHFDDYPEQKFGTVIGFLENVSDYIDNNTALVHFKLKDGLITDKNFVIPYKSDLKFTIVIITRRVSLLHRLYSRFTNRI